MASTRAKQRHGVNELLHLPACLHRHAQTVPADDHQGFFRNALGCQLARPVVHALPEALHVAAPLLPDVCQPLAGPVQNPATLQ